MPNWCHVNITLTHADPTMLNRVEQAINNATGVLKEFIPVPSILLLEAHSDDECIESCGYANWYDFCSAEWGTKWDLCNSELTKNDNGSISISCDTAWGPPIEGLEKLITQGFSVMAYYYEPGMQFAGIFDNGNHQEYSSWGSSIGANAVLPRELNDFFEIAVTQREWEDEEKDDIVLFIEEGLEKTKPDTTN